MAKQKKCTTVVTKELRHLVLTMVALLTWQFCMSEKLKQDSTRQALPTYSKNMALNMAKI